MLKKIAHAGRPANDSTPPSTKRSSEKPPASGRRRKADATGEAIAYGPTEPAAPPRPTEAEIRAEYPRANKLLAAALTGFPADEVDTYCGGDAVYAALELAADELDEVRGTDRGPHDSIIFGIAARIRVAAEMHRQMVMRAATSADEARS